AMLVHTARGTMPSMRILHLVTRSQRRGAELVALDLARELDALGHENRTLALGRAFDGSTTDALPQLTSYTRLGVREFVPCVRKLRALLARDQFDVVLAHGGWPVQVAAFAHRSNGPLVVWQRILGFPDSVWKIGRRQWWQVVVRRVDAAVALTTDNRDELR